MEVKPPEAIARVLFFLLLLIKDENWWSTSRNSPEAQSSSSAPFSQSFSPSHLHDNETHLLVDPPQSNFSGGHVCLPVGRDKRDRKITPVVLWPHKGSNKKTATPFDWISVALMMQLKLNQDSTTLANWFYCLSCILRDVQKAHEIQQMHSWL